VTTKRNLTQMTVVVVTGCNKILFLKRSLASGKHKEYLIAVFKH